MPEVILAGYNVDADIIEKLKKDGWDGKNNISPETISAAYARISRDPRPVNELRADSTDEVDKARKSNENIVFKMGHHSVAEHALLNFDILKLSRLAVETLQEARLCGYTEKSQRYITLKGDYVTPEEFSGEDKKLFADTVSKQVDAYNKMFPVLHEYQKKNNPDMLKTKWGESTVEGWAKEDARYMLALATECQLGFSSNARNLEHIIRKLKYSPLAEVRELGKLLYERAKEIVPSLIILSDADAFKKQFGIEVSDGILKTGKDLLSAISKDAVGDVENDYSGDIVKLVDYTDDPDTKVIAAIIQANSGIAYHQALAISNEMKNDGKQEEFIHNTLKDLSEHDSLFREFENVNFVLEISLSAGAFGQMKRHRMMSIVKQSYDPGLGVVMPEAIKATGQEGLFNEVIKASEATYIALKEKYGDVADYVLTNAHKRRILVNTNLRELYHIARLRMDKHAQWDIQNVSRDMVEAIKKVAPLTAALACGKDTFKKVKEDFFKQ